VPTAIVSGALANKPFNGGEAWVRLSWVLGLRRLGFDTYFVEELNSRDCVDRYGEKTGFRASANRDFFDLVVGEFGLEGRAGLLGDDGSVVAGLALGELRAVAADAKFLVNLSGHLTHPEILPGPRTSVYVDLDPGFTQAWHADAGVPFEVAPHDHYVTVGLNVGTPVSTIPDCGFRWIPTLPPVVLEEWPESQPRAGRMRFTTVATWRSPFGSVEIGGEPLGLKHHQFRQFFDLPGRVPAVAFELALDIHPADSADLRSLSDHGWKVVSPGDVAATPSQFRDYVMNSGGEFSVAQEAYTKTRSGWFSDRTAAYLACGRPALVQGTGLDVGLGLGKGLVAFASPEEAAASAEEIAADYSIHAVAARAFAEEHLDSDRVLSRLLERIGVG
jgi:hypothetical protein